MSRRALRTVSVVPVSLEQALADDVAAEWAPVAETGPAMIRATIATGRALIEAKRQVKEQKGRWLAIFRHTKSCPLPEHEHVERPVPFGRKMGHTIMRIAEHPMLGDVHYNRHFPANTDALSTLARLPEPTLQAALDAGVITPGMSRQDVAALRVPTARTRGPEDWLTRQSRWREKLIEQAQTEEPEARRLFVEMLRQVAMLIEENLV